MRVCVGPAERWQFFDDSIHTAAKRWSHSLRMQLNWKILQLQQKLIHPSSWISEWAVSFLHPAGPMAVTKLCATDEQCDETHLLRFCFYFIFLQNFCTVILESCKTGSVRHVSRDKVKDPLLWNTSWCQSKVTHRTSSGQSVLRNRLLWVGSGLAVEQPSCRPHTRLNVIMAKSLFCGLVEDFMQS